MQISEMLIEAYGRVREVVHNTVEDISEDGLVYKIDKEANTISWLVWHLARVQDDHIAHVSGNQQVWLSGGWYKTFHLPFTPDAIGYGQSIEEVAQVKASNALLLGYYDAVHEQTLAYLSSLNDDDYDRVVDTSWDPPVTLGARLVSVLSDDLQHAGQAAYVRGIYERR